MVVRLTNGRKLPRSIAEGLLLDQARRCVENHRDLMNEQGSLTSDIKKSWLNVKKSRQAYERVAGKSLETSL